MNLAVVRWSPASETLAEASTPAFLSFLGAALNASVTEVNFTDDAAGLHTVQLASLGCGGKVLEPKEVAKLRQLSASEHSCTLAESDSDTPPACEFRL